MTCQWGLDSRASGRCVEASAWYEFAAIEAIPSMTDSPPVSDALQRLEGALRHLESAVEGHGEKLQAAFGLEDTLHQLGVDRSRLAQALDEAEGRSARLESVNREVSTRLVAAMETIREVLARHQA